MLKLFSQKYFRRIFGGYSIVLILVVSVLSGFNYSRIIEHDRVDQIRQMQGKVELLVRTLDSKFDEMYAIGVSLRENSWINKAKSHSEVLLRDLDYFTRREICEEFSSYKRIVSISKSVALFLPEKRQVIDSTTFWTPETWYLSSMAVYDEDFLQNLYAAVDKNFSGLTLVPIHDVSNTFAVANRLDSQNNPELVLTVLLDGNAMSNFINYHCSLDLHSFQIEQNDTVVYRYRGMEPPHDSLLIEVPSEQYHWCYHASVAQPKLAARYYFIYGLSIVILPLLCSVLLAFGVALITYRPLQRLQSKLKTTAEAQNEFYAIEESFNQIRSEQENQRRLAESYYNSARNNLLLSLMYAPFNKHASNETLHMFGIPFDRTTPYLYMVVILSFADSSRNERTSMYAVALQEWSVKNDIHVLVCNPPENEIVLVIYEQDLEERRGLEAIARQTMLLREYCNEHFPEATLLSGLPHHYLMGISRSYQEAREDEIENETGNLEQYYFPLDWEIQMISQLRAGNVSTVSRIIQEVQRENNARQLNADQHRRVVSLINELMLRVAAELNLKGERVQETHQPDLMWEQLLTGLEVFENTDEEVADSGKQLGEQMQHFVDENFRDTNLTQKFVAAHFQLSCPSVSRIFKNATGKYFVDYLHTLRTNAVKEMLDAGETDLRKVSTECGYENNATFRRAFFRAFAVTPHQYMLQCKPKEEE